MGKRRRTFIITFVIGCHCFVYFIFIHSNFSWHDPPDVIDNSLGENVELPKNSSASPHSASLAVPSVTHEGKSSLPTILKMLSHQSDNRRTSFPNPHPYNFTINQPDICSSANGSSRLLAIVLVCSAVQNFEERQVIRETWGSIASFNNTNRTAQLVFLLGFPKNGSLQDRIESEAQEHGDIIQENFLDTYLNLTLKSVMLLKWVKEYCQNVLYVLKTDDDMYINIPNFIAATSKLHLRSNVMFGQLFQGTKPNRNPSNKWFLPKSQFPGKVVPDYLSGTAYAMTIDVVPKLYNASLYVPFIQMEDIYITGVCASKVGVQRVASWGFTYLKRPATGCAFKQAVSGHHVNNEEKRKIWKELNSNNLKCASGKKKPKKS